MTDNTEMRSYPALESLPKDAAWYEYQLLLSELSALRERADMTNRIAHDLGEAIDSVWCLLPINLDPELTRKAANAIDALKHLSQPNNVSKRSEG